MSIPNAFTKSGRTLGRVALLLLLLVAATAARADTPKQVLVLHTHHQGWEWSDGISRGIQEVLAPFAREIVLHMEYLDMGRTTRTSDFAQLADLLAFKWGNTDFDVVVAVGEGALQFLEQQSSRILADVPVIFCAVAPEAAAIGAMGWRATGVTAVAGHDATLRLMLALHPEIRRIIVLIDPRSISPNERRRLVSRVLQPLMQRVAIEVWADPVWTELPARLVSLGPGDLIYLATFHPDRSVQDLAAAETVELVTHWSPVPVYGAYDFFLDRGVVGGMMTVAARQGERAGQMALRILSGASISDIGMPSADPHHPMFDGRLLRRFHLKTDRLPDGSEVLHPAPDFKERYARVFLYLAGAAVAISILLCAAIMRQKRRQRQMAEINAALDTRVRERSAQLQLVHQKLKKQSLVDGVTGLPNRRQTYQRLVDEAKKAQRYGHPLSVVLCDIDWLKGVNLEHGYALGDTILRDVGQTIRRTVREIDLVGRYGGEEFLVILPHTDIDQSRQTAERIQHEISQLRWEQGEVRITISTGLAQLKNQSPADLLKQVSERLGTTKAQGIGRQVEA
ncbi:ABC transporter substrate binding protein [Desulfatitalea alkaliphila]|uniref:diguanylate cyclase n=1 Tax=Desulfatitalea alkaliphila TaxID=2929485 RepID=A0AA41R5J0_9BACT|nr:ABC transporter substrate binding protein [Desulfatitalea alkaliphila]MCJ8501828.1 diguanylate cyclase [Desulfatitalea alkaliphila]